MQAYSPKQADVLLHADARSNLLHGAVRSGKTWVGYDLILKRLRDLPRGNRLLVGKTERTLRRNIIHPMQERFGRRYIGDLSNGEVRIFGTRFYCVGANDERALQKIQGLGLIYAYGDEITTWPESFYRMLLSRLSDPGAIFDGSCNAEGPFHWLKVGTIDRAAELNLKLWHFTLEDNPFLDPAFVSDLKREYVGVWHQRMILGLWVAAEGAIYAMLDEAVHVADELPEMIRHWVGVDYGTSSVTTFWLLGLGVDHRLYFLDRWRWDAVERRRQRTDVEFAEEMDAWLLGQGVTPRWIFVPADAASFMAQLYQTARQKRANGEPTALINLAYADQSPGSVLDGIRDLSTLLARGRLLFSRAVQKQGGLAEWAGYAWDAKAQARGEDAPLKQNDHDPDAGRYVVRGVRDVWSSWPAMREEVSGTSG
jgi:PBSX family phage terminase large subunit